MLTNDDRRSYLTPAGGGATLSKRSTSQNVAETPYDTPQNGYGSSYGQSNGTVPYYESRSPSPYARPGSSNSYASQRQAEDLEGQNDEELEGLGAKVKLLKDVSDRGE